MPTLPSFRRIFEQDYPENYRDLIKILSVSLNNGFDVLYQLLNGKLTIKDNLASTIKSVQLQVNASGIPQSAVTIKKTTTDRIEGLVVVKATNLTNSNTYPSGGIFISYTETSDSIIINHITGLQASNLYEINIIALR